MNNDHPSAAYRAPRALAAVACSKKVKEANSRTDVRQRHDHRHRPRHGDRQRPDRTGAYAPADLDTDCAACASASSTSIFDQDALKSGIPGHRRLPRQVSERPLRVAR